MIENLATNEKFAVKAFSKEYLRSQKNGKESFINEIQIMQDITHPNIIDLVEIHESQNSLYLVMELLEGGEIFSLSKGKLDNDSTFAILKGILKALVAMDKQGIMHRDLKPDNIILKKKDVPIVQNTLKLVDFGLATYQNVDEYLFKRCGTPGFVAPEVINAKKAANVHYSTKCDVFSVGIIFFFMLTGKIPYDGKDFEEVLENNKKAVINFDVKELKFVTPVALNLLRSMLELDPVDRLTATQCLQHEYFVNEKRSFIMDDDDDEFDGVNLEDNLRNFREKYKEIGEKVGKKGLTDSIKFNANVGINGNLDTINSTKFAGSKGSNMSKNTDPGKISSFHSTNRKQKQGGAPKEGKVRPSIYRYALMNKNKEVNLQKELEKMVSESMHSYDSRDSADSDSDSDSKSSTGSKDKVVKSNAQGLSRFAGGN